MHPTDIGGTASPCHTPPYQPPISVSPRISASFCENTCLCFFLKKCWKTKNRQILEGMIPLAFRIGGDTSPRRGAAYGIQRNANCNRAHLTDSVKSPGFDLLGRARKLPLKPRVFNIFSASKPVMFGWNHLKHIRKYWGDTVWNRRGTVHVAQLSNTAKVMFGWNRLKRIRKCKIFGWNHFRQTKSVIRITFCLVVNVENRSKKDQDWKIVIKLSESFEHFHGSSSNCEHSGSDSHFDLIWAG